MKRKNQDKTLSLAVTPDLTVRVIPNQKYEFLMTTLQVASGYGCSYEAVKSAKNRHKSDFVEGIHYIPSVQIEPMGKKGANNVNIYWTKAGVIRLGFFIKSEQAKQFRNWAEKLILKLDKQVDLFGSVVTPQVRVKSGVRSANRISKSKLLSLMVDVCKIEDNELRVRISNKLMGEGF